MELFDKSKSKKYIDYSEITSNCQKIAKLLNRSEIAKSNNLVVIVVMNGGFFFSAELLKFINNHFLFDYVQTSRYKNNIQGGEIDLVREPVLDVFKKDILLLDDIFDEGDTLDFLKKYFISKNVSSFTSVTLLKKNKKRLINIEPDYHCFDVDDNYFFGFGMDYKGFYRNLQDIYYVEL